MITLPKHKVVIICGRKDLRMKIAKLKDTQEYLEKREKWEIEKHGTVVATEMNLAVSYPMQHK